MNPYLEPGQLIPKGLRSVDKEAIRLSQCLLEGLQKRHSMVAIEDAADVRKVSCNDEKGKLTKAVVSLPTYLDWGMGINMAEIENMANKPDRLKAVIEHMKLIGTLLMRNVELIVIKPTQDKLEGVYTRDIGFVVGNKCIHANFVAEPRWAEERSISGGIKPPAEVKIEGGNALIDGNMVFLGIGDRTNIQAAVWLQEVLGTEFEVVPLFLQPGVLHLDCAFSPIAKPNGTNGGALVYSEAFVNERDIALLRKVYGRLFAVNKQEYKNLGLNTFALDQHTRIVNPNCPIVCEILAYELHQTIVPVGLDEIVKGEGYARCSVMPLVRE